MTTTNNKLDNDTVRRLSKLISGSKSSNNSTPIMTGTVVQNDNSLYVAIDDDTLVPISDTSATVNVGDKVTIALDDETALIVGNNTDKSVATTNLTKTENGLKLDIEGKASKAELTLESDKLQSSITDTKKDLNNTITQTAEGLTVKITNAQDTADTAKINAATAQTTANTAKTNAATAQTTADAAKTAAATAQTSADDARKVATNYLSFNSTDGLVVGDMTASTLKGNTQITSSGVNVRNGKTTLATFTGSKATIGAETGYHSHVEPTSFSIKDSSENNVWDVTLKTYKDSTGATRTEPWIRFWGNDQHRINSWDKSLGGLYFFSNYGMCLESSDTTTDQAISVDKEVIQLRSYHTTTSAESGYTKGSSYILLGGANVSISCDGTLTKNSATIYGEKVLYNNASGTTSTVTLSESAANFIYLEIYYKNTGANGANTKSVKIYSPNGKVVNLTDFYKANTTPVWQLLTSACTINGTSITRENAVYINSDQSTKKVSTGTNTNTGFAITRVVGIK